MASNIINNNNSSCQPAKSVLMVEKKATARPPEQLNCPRCHSTNTKFCYYNNYSLTQPRYFCKTCRRYWTEGGSLRNVPVGGGSRKNKRLPTTTAVTSSSSLVEAAAAASSSVSSFRLPDLNPPSLISQFNTTTSHAVDGSSCSKELNLGIPSMQESSQGMELLRSSGVASRGLISTFMPTLMATDSSAVLFSSGLADQDQEFKPNNNLSFSMDHGVHQESSNGAKILFPFGELKHEFPRATDHEQSKKSQDQDETTNTPPSGSYWSGMLDHGGSW